MQIRRYWTHGKCFEASWMVNHQFFDEKISCVTRKWHKIAAEIFLIDSRYDAKQSKLMTKKKTLRDKIKFNQSCESGAEINRYEIADSSWTRENKGPSVNESISIAACAGAASESNTYFTSS
jgi:hypothetical protein